jgi:hypothetical protein
MTRELQPLDVTNTPDVLRLAEEVASTGVPRVLRHNGHDLAVVRPATPTNRRRSRQSTAPNAWLEGLIGIATSDGPTDVSANVHAYIAEATHTKDHESNRR